MCDVFKLGHVTRYGQEMLKNFPPKMATVFIDGSLTLLIPDMKKGKIKHSVRGNRSVKTSNCTSKDHRDKIKVPDPVVKDLISSKL